MTNRSTWMKVAVASLLSALVVALLAAALHRNASYAVREAAPTITRSSATEAHLAVIGDSYTGGSDYGGYPPKGWAYLVIGELQASGFPVIGNVSGRGGSGYVRRGSDGTIFGEEASRIITEADELVVFFGSVNDAEVRPDQLASAVNNAFDLAKSKAPRAALLVIGPVWPKGNTPPDILGVRDILAAATRAHAGAFVDPIEEQWLQGRPDLIGADGIHPTDAGHQLLAQLIEPHVVQFLRRD